MSVRAVRIALVALLFGVAGCAVGERMIVGRDSYRLYRQTRIAPTLEARLGAGNRYLHEDPRGPYAEEVRAWFAPGERKYVEQAHDSLPMLKAYLAAMPDGPSAKQVSERAVELESAARFAEARKKQRGEHLESMESGFERAATQRKEFVQLLSTWLGELAEIKSYGQPFDALDPELRAKLGFTDPAVCPSQICSKPVATRFAIPHAGSRLIPRDASFFVEVAVADGRLTGARIRGRELFSRVGEALDLRAVSFADPQSRAEAIGRALPVVVNALGAELSAANCERDAVSPVVLERSCDGVRLTATAALASGEDDIVMFEAEAPPAPPPQPSAAPSTPRPRSAPSAAPPAPKQP